MMLTEELNEILKEYDLAVQEVQKKRKFMDGVFGFGNHPGNAACHEQLDQKMESLCRRAAESGDEQEIYALTKAVFEAGDRWEGPEYARLMLVAVQRHAMDLIPMLSSESRKELAAAYDRKYPRRKRLPVQEPLYRELTGKK